LDYVSTDYRLLVSLRSAVHVDAALAVPLDEYVAGVVHFDLESIADRLLDHLRLRIAHGVIEAIQANAVDLGIENKSGFKSIMIYFSRICKNDYCYRSLLTALTRI